MPTVTAKESKSVNLEPGTYEVICIKTEEAYLEKPQFGDGHVVRITMNTTDEVDEDGELIELSTIANFTLTPKSKLWGIFEAFGIKPTLGQDLDTDLMVGKRAFAVTGQKPRDDGSHWVTVEALIPPLTKKELGSLTKPDGTTDFAVFWKMAEQQGFIDKDELRAKAGKPMGQMTITELQELIGLNGQVEPDDIPFE